MSGAKSARMLGRSGEVGMAATGGGLTLTLPPAVSGEIDRVVVLQLGASPHRNLVRQLVTIVGR